MLLLLALLRVIGLSYEEIELVLCGLEYTGYSTYGDYRRRNRGIRLCIFCAT